MFYRWRRQRQQAVFNRRIAGILETPPVQLKDAPWTVVSMVSDTDVLLYLLGIKSFYARLGAGKVVAIVAKSMPGQCIEKIEEHIRGIRIQKIEEIDTGSCQRGGTWERLLYILNNSVSEYTIQIDCDTLSFGADISEIRRCAENNIPFTLSSLGHPLMTMSKIAQDARSRKSNYIGIVSERRFEEYPDAERLHYVRGSSGFAGFSKGGFSRERMEQFHKTMHEMLGKRWLEWGSEQTASNFAIANSPGAIVLPYPKYANFGPECKGVGLRNHSFLHFVGTYRHMDGTFAKLGQEVISDLKERIV